MSNSTIHRIGYFARKYIAPGMALLLGKKRYRYFEAMCPVEWMETEQIKMIQAENLKKLINYAVQNVAYYRELKNKCSITKNSEIISVIESIPIVSKETIQVHWNEMISSKFLNDDLIIGYTGGSTGKLLKIAYDKEFMEKKEAGVMRSLSWGGWSLGEPVAMFWGGLNEAAMADGALTRVKRFLTGQHLVRAYKYDEDLMKKWVEFLIDHEIKHLYGYASVLYNLALFQLKKGRKFYSVKAVYSTAETLFPHYRSTIENAFQCKVYDQYGSREVICIGSECEKGNMHILSDMVFPEFHEEKNSRGVVRIILTSFVNRVMPFIRYDIGDYGAHKQGLCSCGRGFPLMSMQIGRSNDHVRKPDGQIVYPSYFIHLLDDINEVMSFQFRQTGLNDMVLLIEKKHEICANSQRKLSCLEKRVQHELEWDLSLDIQQVNSIDRATSGKHRYVVCEIEHEK